MCAKIWVIWRCSKKSPHSGGTIWSNLSHFLNKGDFFHHLQITQFLYDTVTHMCQTCLWKKIWKKYIFYNAPMRYRPMFWSVSLEGSINSKKIQKNIKPWKPSFVCARDHVCQNWGNLEVVEKITAFRRDHWSKLKPFSEQRWFFPPPTMTQFPYDTVTHMCQTCPWKKIWKKYILQWPLEV